MVPEIILFRCLYFTEFPYYLYNQAKFLLEIVIFTKNNKEHCYMYGGPGLSLEIFPTLFGQRLPLGRSLSTSSQATIKIHHLIFSFSNWKEDIQLKADLEKYVCEGMTRKEIWDFMQRDFSSYQWSI